MTDLERITPGSRGGFARTCSLAAVQNDRTMDSADLHQLLKTPGAYAGVGARATPPEICELITDLAQILARRGWVLRSGAAEGADQAFERGAGASKEIYLPYPRFRGHRSDRKTPSDEALRIARDFHPAWEQLQPTSRALMGRNTHQVLGDDCRSPVRVLICWTPDGAVEKTSRATGGTGQAIRIAIAHGIPVVNLRRAGDMRAVQDCVFGVQGTLGLGPSAFVGTPGQGRLAC